MPHDDRPLTKDALLGRINAATTAEELDEVEDIAREIGYKDDGILLRTLTERRGRFAKRATARK
jgi:hypothetical protein